MLVSFSSLARDLGSKEIELEISFVEAQVIFFSPSPIAFVKTF